jgi:hypothetical protein
MTPEELKTILERLNKCLRDEEERDEAGTARLTLKKKELAAAKEEIERTKPQVVKL